MKWTGIIAVLCFTSLFFVNEIHAQERGNDEPRVSPNAEVGQTIGTTEVLITYGRPSVNERVIFGDLVPWNEVWRTGANESTVISFSDDVMLEGEHVEAGTYSLYTLPGEEEWEIILSNKLSWGTQYDEAEDVLRVAVDAEETHFLEQMMIYFENVTETSADLVIHWDETRVPVTIETQSH